MNIGFQARIRQAGVYTCGPVEGTEVSGFTDNHVACRGSIETPSGVGSSILNTDTIIIKSTGNTINLHAVFRKACTNTYITNRVDSQFRRSSNG
ncbi:hypothetical protein D9M68_743590 [compost metagenome]